MARMRYNHNSFSIGVLSKKVQGNTEFEGYNNALDECVNFIIQQTGGLFKRGGTHFVGEIKSPKDGSAGDAILILFSYSADEQYILEFGAGYIRFFSKYGRVLDDKDEIVEVETPFDMNDIKDMKTFQEGNTLTLVTNKGIFILERTSMIEFNLSGPINYTAEPLTFMNHDKIALKPNKTKGTDNAPIIITVVDPKDNSKKPNDKFKPLFFKEDEGHSLVLNYRIFNDKSGFYEDQKFYLDILNVEEDGETGFNKVKAIVNSELTTDNKEELPNDESVTKWQIGAFNAKRGMPKAAAMYEGRLFLADNKSYQTGIWGSSKMWNDWSDFYTSANDADGLQFKMNALHADEILWLVSQSKLFAGTSWGIYIAGAATFNDEAITPSNFRLALFEATGASKLQPVTALDSVFFVDVSGRNVYEIHLSAETGTYEAIDISLLSNDLTLSGIVSHTWQQTPIKTYWCAVEDGHLCSLTYLKSNGVMAWAKHEIAGKNVKVENICAMHGDKNDYIWMIVRREINGEFKRYIEYISPSYDPMTQEEFKQFYVDSGITKSIEHNVAGVIRGRSPKIKFNLSKDLSIDIFENILNASNKNILMYLDVEGSNSPLDEKIQLTGKNWNIEKNELTSDFRLYDKDGNKLDANKWERVEEWETICYGAGKFVSIAYNSQKVAYSDDGITWKKSKAMPIRANWTSVCYGNDKFVAVAYDSKIAAYSEDGETWKLTNPLQKINWRSICYGNGRFVAVNGLSNVAYSFDGIDWNEISPDETYSLSSVCYGNGKFVAVSYNSDYTLYSEDGVNWTKSEAMPQKGGWTSVCYGNGKFVAIGIYYDKALYSEDGIEWKETTLPGGNWMSVCYGGKKFVAVTENSNIAAYSEDGIEWTKAELPSGADWNSVCYGKDKFVAIAEDLNIATYSEDGIEWKETNIPGSFSFDGKMYLEASKITRAQKDLNDKWRIYCETQFLKEHNQIRLFFDGVDESKYAGDYEIIQVTADYILVNNLKIDDSDFKGKKVSYNFKGDYQENPLRTIDGKVFLLIPATNMEVEERPINTSIILEEADTGMSATSVYIDKVRGTTQLNQNRFGVLRYSADGKLIELQDFITRTPLNGENFSPFDTVNPRGIVYEYFNEVKNLEHLAGQEVALCIDGNSTSNIKVPENGIIELEHPAMYCSVGLPFTAVARTTPFSGGSLIGSSVGEVGSQKSMWLHLYYSLGGQYGSEPSKLYDIPYNNFISAFDKTKNLITGLVKCPIISSKDVYDRSIYIKHTEPLSFNILSITQDVIVSDG